MLLRSALCLALSSLFVVAVGCSAGPGDVAKDGKRVSGSPNDPGFQPPGANPGPGQDDSPPQPGDDQEQPGNGPNCTPPPRTALLEGWKTQSMHHFRVDVPASWSDVVRFDDGKDGGVMSPFWADLVMHDVSFGSDMRATEQRKSGTPDAAIVATKLFLDSHGISGACVVKFEKTTFRCDPAALITVDCKVPTIANTTQFSSWLYVFHGGETFVLTCQGVDEAMGKLLCTQMNASLEITM